MTCHLKRALMVVAALTLAVAGVQAGVTGRAEFDKEHDFSKARTFGWHPEGEGDVKLPMREGGDGPRRQIAWRGIAEAQVDRQRAPVERDKRIREAVAELLKKYPPKARK